MSFGRFPCKGFRRFLSEIFGVCTHFFGELQNVPLKPIRDMGLKWRGPHSLGKLIEWKHGSCITYLVGVSSKCPHSLGKLIEWKRWVMAVLSCQEWLCPHSLGKLIEWKPPNEVSRITAPLGRPHSLGKLIEWKRNFL